MTNDVNKWAASKEELQNLCSFGKMCPKCRGGNIKYLGSACDFFRPNNQYRCNDCKQEWEGY